VHKIGDHQGGFSTCMRSKHPYKQDMTTTHFIQYIRQLIAADQLPTLALGNMRLFAEKTPLLNDVLQQSGRLAHIRQQNKLGLVTNDEATTEQNRIRYGLLELLDDLEQNGTPLASFDALLAAVEQESTRPEVQAEVANAISIVNSKNVVVGATITAGGNVHIGDTINNHFSENQTQLTMKEDQSKAIWLSILIAAFGVAIGFLGELMPDSFKNKVEIWSTSIFGISYIKIWVITTALVVLIFLWLIWKEALKSDKQSNDPALGNVRKIKQGKKSVYIEKNEGPININ
jgi:hypothetical protein